MASRDRAVPPILGRLATELRWHRRPIAAACAMLALLSAVHTVRPGAPPSAFVLVAAHQLAAGHSLASGDLRATGVPLRNVPQGALRSPPLGRVVALPIREGEIVTDVRLLGSGLLTGLGPGIVAAPVHLADAATTSLVRVGDIVDVLAAGESGSTTTVAYGVRVLVTPAPTETSALRSRDQDGVIVLAVSRSTATSLARAAATARLSLVLRSADES